MIQIDGQEFDLSASRISFDSLRTIRNMEELQKLSALRLLKSVNFCGTNLNDIGLRFISTLKTLEHLDLQETEITNQGLAPLSQMPNLKMLRLKGNAQLTNGCMRHIREIRALTELQIQETSIDQDGLMEVVSMPQLREVCIEVWGRNYTFEGLQKLSAQMPMCTFLVKGKGEFINGAFKGVWA